jgi:hypothetical protein
VPVRNTRLVKVIRIRFSFCWYLVNCIEMQPGAFQNQALLQAICRQKVLIIFMEYPPHPSDSPAMIFVKSGKF